MQKPIRDWYFIAQSDHSSRENRRHRPVNSVYILQKNDKFVPLRQQDRLRLSIWDRFFPGHAEGDLAGGSTTKTKKGAFAKATE